MSAIGTSSSATARVPLTRSRRLAVVALGVIALALVLVSAWAAMTMTSRVDVKPQGTAVPVPGGQVTVDSVVHSAPESLGTPLPFGTHAVEISVRVTADASAALSVDASDFAIQGTGIQGVVEPSRVTPAALTVPAGGTAPMTLVYALLDDSSNLVLDLPGGELVSAEHTDHPGDRPAE